MTRPSATGSDPNTGVGLSAGTTSVGVEPVAERRDGPPVSDPDPNLAYFTDGRVAGRVIGWIGGVPLIGDVPGMPESVTVEPVAERRDPQALLDAALDQARALLDERDALRAALDEAIRLTAGPGNGTWTRSRPIEEWRRLDRLFRAALGRKP